MQVQEGAGMMTCSLVESSDSSASASRPASLAPSTVAVIEAVSTPSSTGSIRVDSASGTPIGMAASSELVFPQVSQSSRKVFEGRGWWHHIQALWSLLIALIAALLGFPT